jgi:hypothetical protein
VIVKRVLCLANSRKLSGRCVAGPEATNDGPTVWIRPVSSREHQEVSEYERQYENGSDPKVLDLIDIPLIKRIPKEYQQENWLLDPDRYWVKIGSVVPDDLDRYVHPESPLWIDGYSTYNGLNDKVPIDLAKTLETSLRLIRVGKVTLSVFESGFVHTKRRVQAQFQYSGSRYGLWVTDPRYETEYLARGNGDYPIGPCCLTISLGEAFQGACYKLVAAIIPR